MSSSTSTIREASRLSAPARIGCATSRKIKKYGWIPDLLGHRDHLYAAPQRVLAKLPKQSRPANIHNWCTVINLEPDHNTMHKEQASIPKEVISIFENEGWVSMGNSRNYDFMHFQAAIL